MRSRLYHLTWGTLFLLLTAPSSALAQAVALNIERDTINPENAGWNLTLPTLINQFFLVFLWVSGVAAVFALLWAGFQYITAGGDSEKAANSRRSIIFAIIGILLISASFNLFYATKRVAEHPTNVTNQL